MTDHYGYTTVFPTSASNNNVGIRYDGQSIEPFCGSCEKSLSIDTLSQTLECVYCKIEYVRLQGTFMDDPAASVKVFLGGLDSRVKGEKYWGGLVLTDPTYAELLSMTIARWTGHSYKEISVE